MEVIIQKIQVKLSLSFVTSFKGAECWKRAQVHDNCYEKVRPVPEKAGFRCPLP